MANKDVSQSHRPKEILADLYNSGLLADVTIQLNDDKIRAHRAILAKTSAWFAHQFANDPKYDSKLVINLADDDDTAVKAMVCFCYTGNYSRYLQKPISNSDYNRAAACRNNLEIHFDVHDMAEEYNATSLREYSLEAFNNEAQDLLRINPSGLLPIIKRAYSLCPKSCSLRSAAIKLFNQYLDSLKNVKFPATQVSMIKTAPDEVTKLLIQIAKDAQVVGNEVKHQWECSFCKTSFEYAGEVNTEGWKVRCPWCKVEEI